MAQGQLFHAYASTRLLRSLIATLALVTCTLNLSSIVSADEIPSEHYTAKPSSFRTSAMHWQGFLKNETAYRLQEPRVYTKFRNIAFVETTYNSRENFAFKVSAKAYYDPIYDFYDYTTISARPERDKDQPLAFIENLSQERETSSATINEAFVDMFLPSVDLRLGKQIVVWGVLTGVRVVDEINPMDFHELILLDLLDYRIPLVSAKADIYSPLVNTQLLWIPELRFHQPAPRGSEWELFQEAPNIHYPSNYRLQNSEFGIRFSKTIGEADIALSYFYTWDDFPTIYRHAAMTDGRIDPESNAVAADPNFTARFGEPQYWSQHNRIGILGFTFRQLVFGQVFKNEIAYVHDKRFGLESFDNNRDGFNDLNGVMKRDHIRIGAGIDFSLWKTDFSPSYLTWYIIDYNKHIIQSQWDSSFNLFVRRQLSDNDLLFEFLGIALLNLRELYVKPKLTLRATNNVQVAFGFDLIYGRHSAIGRIAPNGRPTELEDVPQHTQFLGNFADNDRIFIECKYNF